MAGNEEEERECIFAVIMLEKRRIYISSFLLGEKHQRGYKRKRKRGKAKEKHKREIQSMKKKKEREREKLNRTSSERVSREWQKERKAGERR